VTAPAAFAGFPPGTVLLDKYRVIRELGFGGMSLVVCAEHLVLETLVAIKFLLPELATLPDATPRFLREAQAATRISGEHVARVLDMGELPPEEGSPFYPGGTPYIVMEYLEGKDLGRHVKEGKRFSVTEAIDVVVQAAEALARAHAAGIVHRDVKPSNLFLVRQPDGTELVKVLDFGISKVVEEAAKDNLDLTKTTAVMGSALYMSLEQMRSTKTVDHRTDIYALGVTLYELLSGTQPFTAESFSELCVKVSLDPPDPLRRHRPDVSEELAAVIAVAYARAKEERYQSVGQLAQALAPFAAATTRPLVEAIRRFERASHPEEVEPPVRRTPPEIVTPDPGPRWPIYAIAVAAGLAAAATLWAVWTPGDTGGTSGGVVEPDAATDASVTAPVTSVTAPMTTTTTTLIMPVDAGSVDAGKVSRPPDPCAGRKVGDTVILPDGRRKVCGL
jgi:serine/threonine-protein kinase